MALKPQSFIEYLQRISFLSDETSEAFLKCCKEFSFRKNHKLVEAGQVCHCIYFMKKGIGKVYYQKDDKEVIDWIGDEGNIISSFISFVSQQPGIHTVELLEDCEMTGISFN